MAFLFISEYSNWVNSPNSDHDSGQEPAIATQRIVVQAGATSSAAFNTATRMVLVNADTICSLLFGASPTATASSMRLAANIDRYYGVQPSMIVSVIANS
jgi:hypothetical protein